MEIQENISLKAYNTFGIDVKAKQFVELHDPIEVFRMVEEGVFADNKYLVLGGGSNILFTSDFDGIVIKNCIAGIETSEGEHGKTIVTAGAGVVWDDLVWYCIDNDLGGIENLCMIPGTVGAAPIQNIGAYGVELKDVFLGLKASDLSTGMDLYFSKEHCRFGYRDSAFKQDMKGKFIVTSVMLELKKNVKPNTSYGAISAELRKMEAEENPGIREVGNAVKVIRESKLPDPEDIGNAGSFFKNPVIRAHNFEMIRSLHPDIPFHQTASELYKIPAGWLIEQSGWKGKRLGKAAVHDKQALVIINLGGASGKDILDLASKITDSVKEKFGIELEKEVNIV
jgi:UDP-N-acetylmuramate dehydrogenase